MRFRLLVFRLKPRKNGKDHLDILHQGSSNSETGAKGRFKLSLAALHGLIAPKIGTGTIALDSGEHFGRRQARCAHHVPRNTLTALCISWT